MDFGRKKLPKIFAPDFELSPDEIQGEVPKLFSLLMISDDFENNLSAVPAQDQILLQNLAILQV